MGLAAGNNEIISRRERKHPVHRLNIVAGESPINGRIQITQDQFLLSAFLDGYGGFDDLL